MPNRPSKPCAVPGCLTLTDRRRCPAHQQAYEQARGTTTERGLGWSYQRKRQGIIDRDRGICGICHEPGADTVDHIIPRSRGGDDSDANLRAAHGRCNCSRGVRKL